MKTFLSNPTSSAITSAVLTLPFAALFLLFAFGMEPNLGPLEPLLDPENSHLGSIIVFGAVLLLLVGFIIGVMPIVRSLRAGGSIVAHPLNLVLAVITLCFILAFVAAIVVDQYPCWIGVPNCD